MRTFVDITVQLVRLEHVALSVENNDVRGEQDRRVTRLGRQRILDVIVTAEVLFEEAHPGPSDLGPPLTGS
jgi:hypothetical protein